MMRVLLPLTLLIAVVATEDVQGTKRTSFESSGPTESRSIYTPPPGALAARAAASERAAKKVDFRTAMTDVPATAAKRTASTIAVKGDATTSRKSFATTLGGSSGPSKSKGNSFAAQGASTSLGSVHMKAAIEKTTPPPSVKPSAPLEKSNSPYVSTPWHSPITTTASSSSGSTEASTAAVETSVDEATSTAKSKFAASTSSAAANSSVVARGNASRQANATTMKTTLDSVSKKAEEKSFHSALATETFSDFLAGLPRNRMAFDNEVKIATRKNGPGKKIFCYYSSSTNSRPSAGKFWPEHIDPFLCTHLIFAFVDITKDGKDLKHNNWNDMGPEGLYARTMKLRETNPKLKILLAVGGWKIGSEPFLPMIKSTDIYSSWVRNVVKYLRKFGFDGLDMDWEFPGTRGSKPEDKHKFTDLMKGLYRAFKEEAEHSGKERLILTLAAASSTFYIEKAYEPKEIHKYVDYMLIMTYNYHGSGWEKTTGHHTPLLPHKSDPRGEQRQLHQQWSISYWLEQGVPKEKLMVGLATYGLGYKLKDPHSHGIRADAVGGNEKGKYTGEQGILSLYEICEKIQEEGWDVEWIEDQLVPYAHGGDEWVGFESPDSMAIKSLNILKRDLGGAFVWSVEMDDFSGHCGGRKYPLLSVISEILQGKVSADVVMKSSGHGGSGGRSQGHGRRGHSQTRNSGGHGGTSASGGHGGQGSSGHGGGGHTETFEQPESGTVDCNKLGLGIFEDPISCVHFNLCVPSHPSGLRGLRMKCPVGTKFDTDIKICNHEHKVQCS